MRLYVSKVRGGEIVARVELRNVQKKFGDLTVVNDFNLVIEDKEFVVLVGPSGCIRSW